MSLSLIITEPEHTFSFSSSLSENKIKIPQAKHTHREGERWVGRHVVTRQM